MLMKTGKFRSEEDITRAAEFYYKRLKTLYTYSPVKKYRGEIFLLRALENTKVSDQLANDYGLNQVN